MDELENYRKEKLTIDLVWANVFGMLILLPIALLYGLPYYLLWQEKLNLTAFKESLTPTFLGQGFLVAFGFLILGIIVHELIHGLVWAAFARHGFRSIKFGVMWKMLTPYCHCKEPLKVKHYILGAIAPAIVLGVIPGLAAIVNGSIGLLIFGSFFTMAAAGDFLVINLIRKEQPEDLVQDHPSEAGCFIYRNAPQAGDAAPIMHLSPDN